MSNDFEVHPVGTGDKLKWISVKDALPPISEWSGDQVLCYTEEGGIVCGRYEGEEEFYDKYHDQGLITHWMPLPSPPNDKPSN